MIFKKTIPLNEFITLQRGFDLPKSDRVKGEIPVVASTGVGGYHNKAKVKAPGVVIGRSGSIGGGQYITNDFWPLNTTLWVKDFKGHHPRYVYYLLRSINFQQFNVGSGVPTLNRNHLSSILVADIGLKSEKQIAKILGELDDKIELNRQTNQTLEQIAQAIFKSWFVDFEPTRAKIAAKKNGQDPERAAMAVISGLWNPDAVGASLEKLEQLTDEQLKQLKETAALFPDALVDSELGEVPEGWGVGMMKDCCERVESGGTPKRSEDVYWGGGIKWLSSGEVRDVIILDTKETITELGLSKSSAKLWPECSTVVAMYGATAGQVCFLADQMTANQACCALIPKQNLGAFIFLAAKRSIEELAGKASGSAQQNLNKSLVSDHKILIPCIGTLDSFEKASSTLIARWIHNCKENLDLSNARDTLLPKLLSGELAVSGKT